MKASGIAFPMNLFWSSPFLRRAITGDCPYRLGIVFITKGGTLAITMSRLPYFQRHGPNVFSASGYSGSGVALATGAGAMLAEAIDGVATRFDVINRLPTPGFPGGGAFRSPLLALALTWYGLRDRL